MKKDLSEYFINNNVIIDYHSYDKLTPLQINNLFLFMKKDYEINSNCDIELNLAGIIARRKKKYDLMMKYYLMAIEKENELAMSNLGIYYHDEKKYDLMMKYYLMAVEKRNGNAMNNLGIYYYEENKYDLMIKYYLMAIEKGNGNAMINLGYYYYRENKYDLMMKYYLMAIEKGSDHVTNILAIHYDYTKQEILDFTKKYDCSKYFIPDLATLITKFLKLPDW